MKTREEIKALYIDNNKDGSSIYVLGKGKFFTNLEAVYHIVSIENHRKTLCGKMMMPWFPKEENFIPSRLVCEDCEIEMIRRNDKA